jgi:hypothetical protein
MICPFKLTNPNNDSVKDPLSVICVEEECALWNERFGMCSLAVDAYLKGQEDWRAEKEMLRKGG